MLAYIVYYQVTAKSPCIGSLVAASSIAALVKINRHTSVSVLKNLKTNLPYSTIVVKGLLLEREVWGSNLEPIKSSTLY